MRDISKMKRACFHCGATTVVRSGNVWVLFEMDQLAVESRPPLQQFVGVPGLGIGSIFLVIAHTS